MPVCHFGKWGPRFVLETTFPSATVAVVSYSIETMSSTLQSTLTSLQQNDYVTRAFILTYGDQCYNLIAVILLTAVGYDYGEL